MPGQPSWRAGKNLVWWASGFFPMKEGRGKQGKQHSKARGPRNIQEKDPISKKKKKHLSKIRGGLGNGEEMLKRVSGHSNWGGGQMRRLGEK